MSVKIPTLRAEKGRHAREDARGFVARNKRKNDGNCGLKECTRHYERKNPDVKSGKIPTLKNKQISTNNTV